jgi:multicomponent Na+:H+ antiporter subunit B
MILPALGCARDRMEDLLSNHLLALGEALGFLGLFLLGLAGTAVTGFFMADPFPHSEIPHTWFIFLLNLAIGLKVGAGMGLLGLLIIRSSWEEDHAR